MPPKKRKTRKNFLSDNESGGPSDSDSQRTRVGKRSTSKDANEKTNPFQPDKQIIGFVSEQELEKYALAKGIKKIMLIDLYQQNDLSDCYVGGQVIGHYATPYSQGHELCIFIHDESISSASQFKHLTVTISERLAEKIPSLGEDSKLFLYKALVRDDSRNFSQDFGKCLLVDNDEAQVWIVHKNVCDPYFFSLTSCGKKWWKKTKQRREKMKSMWSAENVGKSHKERGTMEEGTTSMRNSSDVGGPTGSNHGSQDSAGFPDNSDFPPDSAFREEGENYSIEPSQSQSSLMPSESSSSSCESDKEWTKRRRVTGLTGREYEYKQLADLQVGDKKVNTIGMVKEFKPPAMTRGSDYYSSLTLIDESDPKVGTKCVLFNKDINKLPHVKREGDIVCLHRVNISSYNCQTQVQGQRYSSAIRFSGEINKKIKPHTGSLSFTCALVERERVREFREWAREQSKENLQSLQSVSPGDYFDLVCQVVSITISKVPRCTVLTVWDATPHSLQCKELNLEKISEEEYPIVKEDQKLVETSEGYVTNVVIYNKKCINKALKLYPGQFVYLKSLHASMVDSDSDLIEICIHKENGTLSSSTRIEILKPKDKLCRDLEEKIEAVNRPVTTACHPNQPLCSVGEIVSYDDFLPAKFRCRARVLKVNALSLEDMVLVNCTQCDSFEPISHDMEIDVNGVAKKPCSVCSNSSPSYPSCQYYFKMTITDKSGELELEVSHEQALQLFNNLRPTNFYQYQELRYELMRKVYALTGGNNPFSKVVEVSEQNRPHPWVDCCVLSLNYNGSIYHCLFDTELKSS